MAPSALLVSSAVEASDAAQAVEIAGGLSHGTLPDSRKTALYVAPGRRWRTSDRPNARSAPSCRPNGPAPNGSPHAKETVRGLIHRARRADPPGLHGLGERLNITRTE